MRDVTYLVFLATEALAIAPRYLVHGVSVAEVGRRLVVLLRRDGVFLDAPTGL